MVAMFGQAPRVDEDIINIYQDEVVEILSEHLVHEILEYGGGIDQAVRHYQVFIVAGRGHESCLLFVPLTYPDEVIRAAEV